MGRCIGDIETFACDWHKSCWRVEDLPSQIGATMIEQSGPSWVLGVSCDLGDGRKVIAVNDWLQRHPGLRRTVIAHEVAHLLLDNTSSGWCDLHTLLPRGESLAWMGAGMLLIPGTVAQQAHTDAEIEQLAAEYDLPPTIAALSVAVHQTRFARNETRWDGQISDAILGMTQTIRFAAREEGYRRNPALRHS